MKCSEVQKHLHDFVLEELDQETEIQVNEHLAQCRDCKKELETRSAVVSVLKGSQRFEPSVYLYNRVKNQLKLPARKKKLLWGMPRNLVYAVAMFFVGVVVMRAVDVYLLQVRPSARIDVETAPLRVEPSSDTVKFYTVPAENLARI